MRNDDRTSELPGVPPVPRPRGRPRKEGALTPAQHQAAYRARKAAEGKTELPPVFLSAEVRVALDAYVARQNADVSKEPITVGDVVNRILKDRLLRPR